jgi:hypothetical protein
MNTKQNICAVKLIYHKAKYINAAVSDCTAKASDKEKKSSSIQRFIYHAKISLKLLKHFCGDVDEQVLVFCCCC